MANHGGWFQPVQSKMFFAVCPGVKHLNPIPVVPHKAVAEVSKIGNL